MIQARLDPFLPIDITLNPMASCQLIYNSNHFLRTKKRTKCVKIIFISVSRDTNNIIHKNNVTRRSKALLTTLLQEMMHAGLS